MSGRPRDRGVLLSLESIDDVEDRYELSPMQQGMLFHTVEAPGSGVYCIVVSYRLHGALQTTPFRQAWQDVVARHPVLRTSFHWHDAVEPVQAVHRRAVLPFRELDWREMSGAEQQRCLTDFLEEEQRRGFDLTCPPLIRITLIRVAEDTYELVITHHHLLMDGSCKPLLFAEVAALYDARREQRPLELDDPRPYREFIEWLRDQDLSKAEAFWRCELDGFRRATALWADRRPTIPSSRDYAEYRAELPVEATEKLRQFARRFRLTVNTVITGMWGLLLAHSSGEEDVVFGATVNGRPPTLAGTEPVVGLFINTVPVRVRVDGSMPIATWLQRRQNHQIGLQEYAFAPLVAIQRWSCVPRRHPLFESVVVFENNPGYGSGHERHGAMMVVGVRPHVRNSFPLTLRCVPGPSVSIQFLYDTRRFSAEVVGGIAGQLIRVLKDLPDRMEARVSALLAYLSDVDRERQAEQASAFENKVREKLRVIRLNSRRGEPL